MSVIVGVTNKRNLVVPPIAIGGGIGPSGSLGNLVIDPNNEMPEKPAGLTTLLDVKWGPTLSPYQVAVNSVTGASYGITGPGTLVRASHTLAEGGLNDHKVLADGTVPFTNGQGLRANFRAGVPNSGEPIVWNFFPPASVNGYKKWYQSWWHRCPTTDFEQSIDAIKFFGYWYGFGGTITAPGPTGLIIWDTYVDLPLPPTPYPAQTSFNWKMFRQLTADLPIIEIDSSGPSQRIITNGTWNRYAVNYELNDIGVANGIIQIWINGVNIVNRTNLQLRSALSPKGIFYWHMDPVWGGGTGISKQRSDDYDVGHVHIAGEAMP